MKLYYSRGACSLVVRIVINEIGIPCEYEAVDLKTKKTENGTDFLEVNPKGAVPTLQIDNSHLLTENAVIQQYLADKYHANTLLPQIGEFRRYKVLEWLNYMSTEVHKGFGALFNPNVPQQLRDEVFIPMLKTKFKFINTQLGKTTFLVDTQFTLPDAYLFVMLTWAKHFKIDLAPYENIVRYFDMLSKRDAIQKSLQEEGLA